MARFSCENVGFVDFGFVDMASVLVVRGCMRVVVHALVGRIEGVGILRFDSNSR